MGFDLESMERLRLTKQVHLHIQLYSLKLFIFIKGHWEHKVLSFLTLRNFCHLNMLLILYICNHLIFFNLAEFLKYVS